MCGLTEEISVESIWSKADCSMTGPNKVNDIRRSGIIESFRPRETIELPCETEAFQYENGTSALCSCSSYPKEARIGSQRGQWSKHRLEAGTGLILIWSSAALSLWNMYKFGLAFHQLILQSHRRSCAPIQELVSTKSKQGILLTLTAPGPPSSLAKPPSYSAGALGLPGYVTETK